MAKSVHDDVLDAMLNYIADNSTAIYFCSQVPTTYTEASSTYALGGKTGIDLSALTPTNGDVSGRKITIPSQTGVSGTANGTCTHVALVNTSGTKLILADETTSQSITNGESYTVPTWDIEVRDPI